MHGRTQCGPQRGAVQVEMRGGTIKCGFLRLHGNKLRLEAFVAQPGDELLPLPLFTILFPQMITEKKFLKNKKTKLIDGCFYLFCINSLILTKIILLRSTIGF